MNRREFFKSIGAVAAIAAAPAIALYKKVFWLKGDGVSDDTEAFQALIDGHEVWGQDMKPTVTRVFKDGTREIYIPPGTYKVRGADEQT